MISYNARGAAVAVASSMLGVAGYVAYERYLQLHRTESIQYFKDHIRESMNQDKNEGEFSNFAVLDEEQHEEESVAMGASGVKEIYAQVLNEILYKAKRESQFRNIMNELVAGAAIRAQFNKVLNELLARASVRAMFTCVLEDIVNKVASNVNSSEEPVYESIDITSVQRVSFESRHISESEHRRRSKSAIEFGPRAPKPVLRQVKQQKRSHHRRQRRRSLA